MLHYSGGPWGIFPDSPHDIGESLLIQLFDQLIEKATRRNDFFAVVRHALQTAGALAYVGNKDKAREIIAGMIENTLGTRTQKGYRRRIEKSDL